jgi:hypothetical protein
VQTLASIARPFDQVTVLGQSLGDEGGGAIVVLDVEYAHGICVPWLLVLEK